MKTSYKRELDHNYLILEQEEFQSNYQAGMLIKNRIPGLLECTLSRMDKDAAFYYEITSRQNLCLVLERRRLTVFQLEALLDGLLRTAESCEEYLLDTRALLLDPDYIYLDPDTWEFSFCLFPCYEGDMKSGLLELAEYLLDRLDKEDPGAVALGYEFYRMAGEENTSLEQILAKWKSTKKPEEKTEEAGEKTAEVKEAPGAEPDVRAAQIQAVMEPLQLHSERGETTFLKKTPGLVLRSENPSYPSMEITGEQFVIGKKKDVVDGFIKARGISRFHGKISKENGIYYLTDLNSTNGTFLNGGRLEVNEKARIRSGDHVGFADVKYVVDLSGELLYNKNEREETFSGSISRTASKEKQNDI